MVIQGLSWDDKGLGAFFLKPYEKEATYGDYDTITMKEWVKQKYFESNGHNTEFQFMIIDPLNEKNVNANKWFNCDDNLYKKYFNE